MYNTVCFTSEYLIFLRGRQYFQTVLHFHRVTWDYIGITKNSFVKLMCIGTHVMPAFLDIQTFDFVQKVRRSLKQWYKISVLCICQETASMQDFLVGWFYFVVCALEVYLVSTRSRISTGKRHRRFQIFKWCAVLGTLVSRSKSEKYFFLTTDLGLDFSPSECHLYFFLD